MDYKEVAKHNTQQSCWVVLYSHVYDVTNFLQDHPGGAKIILQLAGQDATSEYDPVHPPGTLEDSLPKSANLGPVDASTLPAVEQEPISKDNGQKDEGPPPLDSLLNMDDIERVAETTISKKGWAYYYSAADDLISKSLNNTAYRSILLRPRIFVDCTKCSTATTMLSNQINLPIYVAPAAMARLGHPDGERGIGKACATFGTAQVISNNASMTPEQIVEGASPDQVFGWQLYVQVDRTKSERMLERIHKLPQIKFLVLTLDAPVPGKREHDERMKNVSSNLGVRSAIKHEPSDSKSAPRASEPDGPIGLSLFAGTAPDLTWKTTLPWLAQHTKLPIILKGIQTHEDAYMASLYTPQVQGIMLSNHGGRAMDTAPPSVHTLFEIRKYCPEVFSRIDVFVDGGIKRGTDVVKALCLGAKAVGIGRAALFGLGAGGQAGVERVLEILKAEVETCMRLLGVETVDQLGLQHLNTRALEREIYDGPAGLEKVSLWMKSKL